MRRVGMILGQSSSNEKQDDTTAAKEDVSSEEQKLLVESPDPSAEEATQVKSDIDKKGSKKKRKKRKTKSKDISEEPEPKDEEPKSKKRKKKDTKSENDDDDSDNDDKETPKQQSIENKANVGEKKDEESKDDDKQEEADDSSDDDSDDDDEELMAAAAAWAQEQTGEEAETPSKAAKIVNTNVASPALDISANPTNLSLHITQLPYDTNDLDIRRLFSEQGCFVTSIRLVCDQDENGRKTVFRGVAFVDLANVESYQTALEMDRKHKVRGRKLNVRPVRSKEELADVVTRANVTEKIRKQLEDGPVQKEGGADKKEKKKKKEKDKNSPAKK
jgi:RNA recognition motif-containing protein